MNRLKSFEDTYEVSGSVISNTSYHTLQHCIHRLTGQQFVVKILYNQDSTNKSPRHYIEDTFNEASICRQLHHPYILELLEAYTSSNFHFLVFEFVDGVRLLEEIVNRAFDGFVYSEAVASHYMQQILNAVCYLHDQGFIHCDLKPTCIFICNSNHLTTIKLSGFEKAYSLAEKKMCEPIEKKWFGSHFSAPELLRRDRFGFSVDVWSMGVILWILLSGELPFNGSNLLQSIADGEHLAKISSWLKASHGAKALLIRMLDLNVRSRISAREALSYPWIMDRQNVPRDHLYEAINGLKLLANFTDDQDMVSFDGYSDVSPSNQIISTSSGDANWITENVNSIVAISNLSNLIGQSISNYSVNRDINYLLLVLNNEKLKALLRLYDKLTVQSVDCFRPETINVVQLCKEIGNHCNQYPNIEGMKLNQLFTKPYFIGLLRSYDGIVREGFGDGSSLVSSIAHTSLNEEVATPVEGLMDGDQPEEETVQQRIKIVQFQRNDNQPLGVTLKINDGQCVITRIMHGGLVHRQGGLNVGDTILEINDLMAEGKSTPEIQTMLKDAGFNISLKIMPGLKLNVPPCEMYVRALFDYNSAEDDLTPCRDAGVSFFAGDILEVVCKDDSDWWQARRVTESGDHVNAPAGLIPTPELQEWRMSYTSTDMQRNSKTGTWFRRRRHSDASKYQVKRNSAFDKLALLTYEEVARLPSFQHKTLILLGAHGVGRRHIKNMLISSYPQTFAYPLPHTTRQMQPTEKEGEDFYFVSREIMTSDISANAYLEYGTFEGALYGTKLDTIRNIHKKNLIAILDVEMQALKILRTSEFSPFIVFIAAPNITNINQQNSNLERLLRESEQIENTYRHLFDLTIINNDIDQTIELLKDSILEANTKPKWVPVGWIY